MRKTTRFAAVLLVFALSDCLLAVPAGAASDPAAVLRSGGTFEAAFKNWRGGWRGGGLSPIKAKLEGDTLTFDYSPMFYIQRDWSSEIYMAEGEGIPEERLEKIRRDIEDGAITEEEAWEMYRALWAEYPVTWTSEIENYTLSDEEVQSIIGKCVAGFMAWEGVYEIHGREITVEVNVHAETTGSRLRANVRVLPGNALLRSGGIVPGCILWRPYSPLLTMYLCTNDPRSMGFERLAMHEFGHVLGLFDAYGYDEIGGVDVRWLGGGFLPEAPPDRAPYGTIMRGSGGEAAPTEIEMLLWAWKNNRLQLYTESVLTRLGAQVSPAFSD